MWDQCRINRAPVKQFDEAGRTEVEVEGAQIYPDPGQPHLAGHCRIQQMGGQLVRETDAAEQPVFTRALAVAVPVGVAAVDPGCVVTIITARIDPRLNGRRVTVTGVEISTFATARRLLCLDNLN